MAIEPLNQGKIAVATILIHMPQYSVNQSLMFGSVLIKEPSDWKLYIILLRHSSYFLCQCKNNWIKMANGIISKT